LFFNKLNRNLSLTALIGCFLAALLLWAKPGLAKEVKVVTEYLHKFQLANPDGSLGGYATDVVNAIFDVTQDQANILVLPWARAYKMAIEEPNVMIFSLARNPQREEKFHWIGLLSQDTLFAWGLASKFPDYLTDSQQLKKYSFVSTQSSNPEKIISQLGAKRVFRVSDQSQILGMIFKGRAELAVSSAPSMEFRAQKLNLDFAKLRPVYEFKNFSSVLSIAFNIDTDLETVLQYQAAFDAIVANGTLQSHKEKWRIAN
jgi:polar amino acid transport system substrate-binding protein